MFTAAEFRLIFENCPEKLDALLSNLEIEKPILNRDDEFQIYAELDDKIINSLCKKMKSESIIDGYTKLMNLGNLKFDYSETDNELLATILKDRKKIQENLEEKIIESEKISPPSEIDFVEFDYSNVEIEFSRADFKIGIPMHNRKFILSNREILSFPQDLSTQIKNLICEHLRNKEPYNIVEAIEISVKTVNGIYDKKFSPRQEIITQPESPPFTQNELSEVVKSLKLVDDIVKAI